MGAGIAAFATLVLGFLGAPLIDLARDSAATPPVIDIDADVIDANAELTPAPAIKDPSRHG